MSYHDPHHDDLDDLERRLRGIEPTEIDWARPPAPQVKWTVALVWLLFGAGLLFWNLGAYGLWSDEADTLLFAQGVWRTGDTSAVVGDNVYLYRNGMLLRDLHNRATPPLGYYVLAPWVGMAGSSPLVARLPFALCGLLMLALMILWLERSRASLSMWLVAPLASLTSVSFFLYCRQSRYYALAMLGSLLVVWAYGNYRGQTRQGLALLVASLALLGSQYLNFVALALALAVDYAIWQRHSFAWSRRQTACWLLPLMIAAAVMFWRWSSPQVDTTLAPATDSWLVQRVTLFYWQLRDMNTSEQLNLLLLLLAPLVGLFTADRGLLRWPLGIVVYTLAIALFSPQATHLTRQADVRYLAPVILANLFVSTRLLAALVHALGPRALAFPPLLLSSNATHLLAALILTPALGWGGLLSEFTRSLRVTPWEFLVELSSPRPTASTEVSRWLRAHVRPGESVWVVPSEETYPHMAQAPHAIYAWQLDDHRPPGQFEALPPIHFFLRQNVDTIVVYGPFEDERFATLLAELAEHGAPYDKTDRLEIFWRDDIRPELHQHRFRPFREFDRRTEMIAIYRRRGAASP